MVLITKDFYNLASSKINMGILTYNILGLITPLEITYLLIVTVVIGYIFTGYVSIRPRTVYNMMHPNRIDFAALVAAPGIILHELAHKLTAISFGYPAQFQIWTFGLVLAIFLKLISSPLLIIAPGYVNIPAITNAFQYRLIALVGPAVNLLLWLLAALILKYAKNLDRKQLAYLALTKRINIILFIFNMLPFGPLDGAKVFFGPS